MDPTSSDDWNLNIQRRYILDGTNKCAGSDDIKSSHAKDSFWVINSMKFKDFTNDRNSGVDWIGNDTNEGFWAVFGTSICEPSNNTSIDVEEIITRGY